MRLVMVALSSALLLQSCTPSRSSEVPPSLRHLDIETTSSELAAIAESTPHIAAVSDEDKRLDQIIAASKKNLAWWTFLVKNLPAGQIPASISEAALEGISMEKPKKYNAVTTIADFDKAVLDMPEEMKKVLLEDAAFTASISIPMEKFVKLARLVDRSYQTALRWKLYIPYLNNMRAWRVYDVRGYYFLSKRTDLKQDLENWNQLSVEDQTNLRTWILMECFNGSGDDPACAKAFDEHLAAGTLWDFHQEKVKDAADIWNGFFEISNTRPEIVWNSQNPKKLFVPFRTPANLKLKEALRFNLQDEWRWQDWNLVLNFTSDARVHVAFQDGVVPNVNGEGGDTITMDTNTPLEEETTKYMLRHEFGHVLGFPDCYLEFYDPNEKVLVSYQIDVTDIMCSRAGKFKERHFNELKKVYFKSL